MGSPTLELGPNHGFVVVVVVVAATSKTAHEVVFGRFEITEVAPVGNMQLRGGIIWTVGEPTFEVATTDT